MNFGTMCLDNRRIDDIVSPSRKTLYYHNHIPMDVYVDISLLYDFNEMQILIDDEERYYSKKERYMKLELFHDMNIEGFEFKIACDKQVNLYIKSLSITEYKYNCRINRSETELPEAITKNLGVPVGEKPTLEKCISLFPLNIQNEINYMDSYLKMLKLFKFKRIIEKNGNKITYVASDYGFSYAIYLSNDYFDHSLQWYLITNGKPETWHRKADMMEETLKSLMQSSEEFAERMFYSLDDCVGCYKECLAKTQYYLMDKCKFACHGKLKFNMSVDGFRDVRTFIDEIKHIILM